MMPIDEDILAQLVPNKSNIIELELAYHNPSLYDGDLYPLIKALESTSCLVKLDLSGNKISDEGAELLAKLPTLIELNLSENSITDEGAEALAQCASLVVLDLNENEIGDEGAKALAQTKSLRQLYLGYNKLGHEAAEALATSTTLTTLYIHHNNMGNIGAIALAKNQSILDLNIDDNHIDAEGAQYLAQNQVICRLQIAYNPFGNVGMQAFLHSTTLLGLQGVDSDIDKTLFAQLKEQIEKNQNRVELERNQLIVIALTLALHHVNQTSSSLCELHTELLTHICSYIAFPSSDVGWHRRSGEACAHFIFSHGQEFKKRLSAVDEYKINYGSLKERKKTVNAQSVSEFSFTYGMPNYLFSQPAKEETSAEEESDMGRPAKIPRLS